MAGRLGYGRRCRNPLWIGAFRQRADVMDSMLNVRPAHVVGDNCCCEADMGKAYIFSFWCRGHEFLLRKLNNEEAFRLQELCLACQARPGR